MEKRHRFNPRISIVIVTKNQEEFLVKSIPAIFDQTRRNFEIIVVDSGSTDGALEYLQRLPVRVVQYDQKKFNYARAFNLGAREAKGNILVRLSGDVVPANNRWLEELIKPLCDSQVGATKSKQVILSGSDWHHKLSLSVQQGKFYGLINWFTFRTLLVGVSAAFKKSLWEVVPFDESIDYGEDGAFAAEIGKRGFIIVLASNSIVYHSHRYGFAESLKRLWLDVKNVFRFYPPLVWWKIINR